MKLLPKMLLTMSVAAILPLLVAGWRMISTIRTSQVSEVLDSHIELGRDVARSVDTEFARAWINSLGTITAIQEVRPMSDTELQALLMGLVAQYEDFDAIILYDASDIQQLAAIEDPLLEAIREDPGLVETLVNHGNQEALDQARSDGTFLGAPFLAAGLDELYLTLAMTTSGADVLVAKISLQRLRRDFLERGFRRRGQAYLVTPQGAQVAASSSAATAPLDDMSGHPVVATWMGSPQASASVSFTGASGAPMLGGYASLDTLGWGVVLDEPEEDAYFAVRRMRRNLVGWLGLAVALSVAGAVVTSSRISRPIVRFARETHEIAKLRFAAGEDAAPRETSEIEAVARRKDEVGTLARAFRKMEDELRVSVEELRRTTALKERIESELNIARQIQMMILPTKAELDGVEDLDIAGYMEPADEVGGDYYDVLRSGETVKIGMGDVTGHGLESGIVMLMTQTAVRTLLNAGITDSVHFLDVLNRTIFDNVGRIEADKSLTLCLLDYRAGRLTLSGQHEEMIVVRRDGEAELVDTVDLGFPIGLDEDIRDFIAETTMTLETGDGVVLYTDGITEAENPAGEQYGLERLRALIQQQWAHPAQAVMQTVIDDVREFVDGHEIYDDISLLVLKQR